MKKQQYNISSKTRTNGFLGACIPVYIQETVPNGDYKVSPQLRVDFSPFADRFYGDMEVRLRYFKVSFPFLWSEWDDFYIDRDGNAAPYISVNQAITVNDDSVLGYLPYSDKLVADPSATPIILSALPLRAYRAIIKDFYRSSFGSVSEYTKDFSTASGADATTPTYLEYDEFEPDMTSRLQPTPMPIAQPTQAAPFTLENLKTMVMTTRVRDLWRSLVTRKPNEFYSLLFGRSREREDYPQEIKSYLGRVSVNEVVSTAVTEDAGLGTAAGLAYASINGEPFTTQTNDFGFIIGILSIMPENNHIYGIHDSMLCRYTPDDYMQPHLASVGLTAAATREMIELRRTVKDDDILGYAPYGERYRMGHNFFAGEMVRAYDYQVLHRAAKDDADDWAVGLLSRPTAGEYDYLFATSEPHYRVGMRHTALADIPLPLVLPGKVKLDEPEL